MVMCGLCGWVVWGEGGVYAEVCWLLMIVFL